jgi:hypothetical protein
VEVGDATDQRCPGDEVLAVGQQAGHQLNVAAVPLNQLVVGVVVVRLGDLPVLREVIDAHDGVTPAEQLLNDVAADEPGRSADENLH